MLHIKLLTLSITLTLTLILFSLSLVTICGDACPLSCYSAEACFTSWPNAQGCRDGEVS